MANNYRSKKEWWRVKHVRIIGACLIAVFALVAVAVTNASASEPEWGRCVSVKSKGHFEESNCKKEDFKESKGKKTYKGKFEWLSGAQADCVAQKKGHYSDSACTKEDFKENTKTHVKTYKGKYEKTGGPKFTAEGGAGVLTAVGYTCRLAPGNTRPLPREDCAHEYGEGVSLTKVECTKENATGEATGTDEVANVSVRFKGCVSFGLPATTIGLLAGEIQVSTLKGRLGYLNKAAHEVGVLLEPAALGGQFAEFELVFAEEIVHVGVGNVAEGSFYEAQQPDPTPGTPTGNDGVISPITPVNQMTHTFTQDYRIEQVRPYPCTDHECEPAAEREEWEATVNIPNHFEGGPFTALEWKITKDIPEEEFHSAWAPAGEEINNVNTVEGEAEIKG
jgi:hypothetical protein